MRTWYIYWDLDLIQEESISNMVRTYIFYLSKNKKGLTFFPIPIVGRSAKTPRGQAKPKPIKKNFMFWDVP